MAIGDLDGDNDLDLVLGLEFRTGETRLSRIYLNDGSGVLTQSGEDFGGERTNSVTLFDANGDDALDLVINSTRTTGTVWLNDGSAGFSEGFVGIGPNSSGKAVPWDVDEDGDLDLWVNYDQVMLNDGMGNFSSRLFLSSDRISEDGFVADFNGDGKDDLFAITDNGCHYLLSDIQVTPESYLASFSLAGEDAELFADPDGDGIANVFEFASNLDPSTADAAPLTPGGSEEQGGRILYLTMQDGSPVFTAEIIERIGYEQYTGLIIFSLGLNSSWDGPGTTPEATRRTVPINENYQRVILEYEASSDVFPKFFANLETSLE